jgi:hypothetical protein
MKNAIGSGGPELLTDEMLAEVTGGVRTQAQQNTVHLNAQATLEATKRPKRSTFRWIFGAKASDESTLSLSEE